ncbi:NfeD family protein [Sphingomonas oligophenolica]|uniref:NfeD family protein n=1 Tax=Sphingomonas oligophenolica TaxID=301154 RepID=A0A502CRI9_9SPHN|nr:NfeD family protein [Sphingomonas oligophenolica]TPG14416.1 NfeD family protein [Sphingomonas oligophenolica]
MSLDWVGGAAGAWLIAALVLGIAEILIPGVFAIFLAIAAAITGIAVLALPDLTAPVQIASFAIWSTVTVLIGKRWYRDYPLETSDALLNNRSARLIGQIVTVETAIDHGEGRVRIGDGSWPAHGPDALVGESVRVTSVVDGVVVVDAVEDAPA